MGKIEIRPCSCIICGYETSQLGIVTHYNRTHSDASAWNNANIAKANVKISNIEKYKLNPNYCDSCGDMLPYNKRNNICCSHRCSAIKSNAERTENGWNMPESAKQVLRSKNTKSTPPFSKVSFINCKFCDKKFLRKAKEIVCCSCQHLKWNNNKDKWSFKFNVFDFPDLFDLQLIIDVGWVSYGGRSKIFNPNGLSRDHRVSVNEAKKFNYDPYYISHPCNCEIMLHAENNKKKSKSSLSYSELIAIVDLYDGENPGI